MKNILKKISDCWKNGRVRNASSFFFEVISDGLRKADYLLINISWPRNCFRHKWKKREFYPNCVMDVRLLHLVFSIWHSIESAPTWIACLFLFFIGLACSEITSFRRWRQRRLDEPIKWYQIFFAAKGLLLHTIPIVALQNTESKWKWNNDTIVRFDVGAREWCRGRVEFTKNTKNNKTTNNNEWQIQLSHRI